MKLRLACQFLVPGRPLTGRIVSSPTIEADSAAKLASSPCLQDPARAIAHPGAGSVLGPSVNLRRLCTTAPSMALRLVFENWQASQASSSAKSGTVPALRSAIRRRSGSPSPRRRRRGRMRPEFRPSLNSEFRFCLDVLLQD